MRVAQMLDDAGFPDASIVLSNELDELIIRKIKLQIAQEAARGGLDADNIIRRLVYGVGTRLITSAGDSSLGGGIQARRATGRTGMAARYQGLRRSRQDGHPWQQRRYGVSTTHAGRATADLLTLDDENPASRLEI